MSDICSGAQSCATTERLFYPIENCSDCTIAYPDRVPSCDKSYFVLERGDRVHYWVILGREA
ncbi:hypothetical protein H6G17_02025 [Chroococcidiopsis sp. FACHB-1243]|uniref:hypothetical protein n=1 Tax=Chroococcidiopsis sp. [FACHB-1243] TaxID=2692781 RepID=UPI0017862671|nr:hypothetical protein [Chroococcidiopsis sp. [FACHB-1243]]MBD2304299.1 hypothetical protein [Chroococcidiopsis sp. [FACHB-1243]]